MDSYDLVIGALVVLAAIGLFFSLIERIGRR